jgi:hypothetical protein
MTIRSQLPATSPGMRVHSFSIRAHTTLAQGDLAWLCLNIRTPLRQRDGESGSLFRERDPSRHQRSAWRRPSRPTRRAGCAVIPSRVRGQREPEFSRLHASTASIRILADALHWSPETCRAPAPLRLLHHLPLIGEEEIS